MLTTAPIVRGEEKQSIPLVLTDAIDLATKLRPELSIEETQEKIAQSKVKETRGNFLPTLDLTGSSYYINNYDSFTGINISARIADQNVSVNMQKEVLPYELSSELNLSYNLYAGGRDRALLGEASSRLESEKYQKTITQKKILLEVANAYWGLKESQLRYRMKKRAFGFGQLETKVAETQHRKARISDIEYEAALLNNREKEVALKTTDRQCLQDFRGYLHVLNLSEDGVITSSEQVPALTDDPSDGNNLAEETTIHPEVLKIKSDIQAKRELKEVAESFNYPSVDFFAKYALIGRDSNSYFDAWGDMRAEDYIVGVKITMNLFNGMKTKERISQAKAEVRIKQLQLKEKEREIAQETNTKAMELETAKDQLALAMERKKLQEAREKVAESEYQSGRTSELAYRQKVLDAENALDEVLIARINVVLAKNALTLMVSE
jgi:outer membrane protein